MMAKRKIEPNTVIKFGLAFIFLVSFGYFITLNFADLNGRTSLEFYFRLVYQSHLGVVCLSPIECQQ
jgi:POT family proton-dependent oligopeptide transporter